MSDSHYYAWVKVGDGQPEPAAIEGTKPDRKATTIGCPDPFYIDQPDCPCQLLYLDGDGMVEEAELPSSDGLINYTKAKAAERRWRAYLKSHAHSYAGFGRRLP